MNSTIITSFLKDKACIDAFLFGSHISIPKASSDIDIVLFTESDVYRHKIFLFENKIFDVFEMSYEQAFEFLRLRHPLWLSAFSNGISLKNADITRLLLVTTQKILNSSKAVSPVAASRGLGGRVESYLLSEIRELSDQFGPKGDSKMDCDADREANNYDRKHGTNASHGDCAMICTPFRPNGLPNHY